jgi:hypothetical protein
MPCAANAIPLDLLTYVVTQDDLNDRGARYYVIEGREKVAYFTPDELTFLKRALPHFRAGKTAAEAMAAVLADDARIINASFKRQSAQFFPTADERGRSHNGGDQIGDCIFSEISRLVHTRLASQVSA